MNAPSHVRKTTTAAVWGVLFQGVLLAVFAGNSLAGELPFTVEWTAVPSLTAGSLSPSSAYYGCALADNRVVYLESQADGSLRILVYDPQTNAWTRKAPVPDPALPGLSLTVLADGRVFMMGKKVSDSFYTVYLYDPQTDGFTRAANMTLNPVDNYTYSATNNIELPSGEIYSFGKGGWQATTGPWPGFLYNPRTDVWRPGPSSYYNQWNAGVRLPTRFWSWSERTALGIFDANQMEWQYVTPGPGYSRPTRPPCVADGLVCWSVAGATSDTARLQAHDPDANAFSVLGEVGNTLADKNGVFAVSIGGRDWLFYAYTAPSSSSAHGLYDLQVRDPVSGMWVGLPRGPVDILTNSNSYENFTHFTPLRDGFLLLGWDRGTKMLYGQRLRVIYTGGTVPPMVAPDGLPASLNLDEDTSVLVNYKVIGDLPPGGVDVVGERLNGDGDVVVLDGSLRHVASRAETLSLRVGALKDGDAVNDQATIRLRVVQPDGRLDPNARVIPVTVNDRYHQDNQPPTIVSAAWANPNPVTLPAASTVAVVAGDPDGDPLTYMWSTVSGPAVVGFAPNGTAASASSSATFGAAGTYVLRVTVGDGKGGSATSDVTVVANPGSGVDPRADVNHDGVVNVLDLQIVIVNFGRTVP